MSLSLPPSEGARAVNQRLNIPAVIYTCSDAIPHLPRAFAEATARLDKVYRDRSCMRLIPESKASECVNLNLKVL